MPSEHTITVLTISAVSDQPDLLFVLHDLARQLRLDADQRAAVHGMTRAQWVILFWLERQPGLSQKELAELLEVEPISVARLIDRLADRGMVERRDDPHDRRIWRLHLLPPAAPVLQALQIERDDMLRVVSEGIDPATLEAMMKGLCRMKTNIVARLKNKVLERDMA